MNQPSLKSSDSYQSQFKELPSLWVGISTFQELQKEPSKQNNKDSNNQTSMVTQMDYISQNFQIQQIVLLILLVVNSFVYYNYQTSLLNVIFFQVLISIINGLLLIYFGLKSSTIPLILSIVATIIAIALIPFLRQARQFMMIPLIYPLGMRGIRRKIHSIYRAIKKQSIWMYLSIGCLFYFFGYISYTVFWKNQKYFKTPIHSSISLLQVSTFDGMGQIISRVAAVSGLALSFGVLVTTLAIFQTLFNINQALIIKYVHQKQTSYSLNKLFINLISLYGVSINMDGRLFHVFNLICTAGVFIVPFQSDLIWLYCLLSILSTISFIIYELTKGNIFSYHSMFNVVLELTIIYSAIYKAHNICFLLCCFRIFLIRQIQNMWKKIRNVLLKVYPMLSLLLVFYLIFAMLIFCLQQQSLQNTFITGLQILALDDWTTYVRSYPWYMKIIILIYMLIGNHILLNSLVSQAFDQLEDKDISIDSRISDSLIESLDQLPPEKKFVSILNQLRFEGMNQFNSENILQKSIYRRWSEMEEEQDQQDLDFMQFEGIEKQNNRDQNNLQNSDQKPIEDLMNTIEKINNQQSKTFVFNTQTSPKSPRQYTNSREEQKQKIEQSQQNKSNNSLTQKEIGIRKYQYPEKSWQEKK